MLREIKIITFRGVNCYLLTIGTEYILIDTGYSKNRVDIAKALENAGCKHGTLKFIILTHGDFDHSGNGVYLREKYGAKIAMHNEDKGMVEKGDLFYNRKVNFLIRILGKMVLFFSRGGLKKNERFIPDIYLEDCHDLSEFGLDARVIHFPGHSAGSIGVLTSNGDMFCGDLLENTKKPAKNSIIADKEAFNASIEKLKRLEITTVYPGHGEPFSMAQFIETQNEV